MQRLPYGLPVENPDIGVFRTMDDSIYLFRLNANLSNPKPGHTIGGSGRSARRSGQAGSGKIACQQNYSPRKQKSTAPSKASKKRRVNVSPEGRTGESLCKTTEEQNQRLTSGLSAVYQQDEKRAFFLAAAQ